MSSGMLTTTRQTGAVPAAEQAPPQRAGADPVRVSVLPCAIRTVQRGRAGQAGLVAGHAAARRAPSPRPRTTAGRSRDRHGERPRSYGSTSRAATSPVARDSTVTSSRQPVGVRQQPATGAGVGGEVVRGAAAQLGPAEEDRSSCRPHGHRRGGRPGEVDPAEVELDRLGDRHRRGRRGPRDRWSRPRSAARSVGRTIRGPPSPHPATAAATSTASTGWPARVTAASCHAGWPRGRMITFARRIGDTPGRHADPAASQRTTTRVAVGSAADGPFGFGQPLAPGRDRRLRLGHPAGVAARPRLGQLGLRLGHGVPELVEQRVAARRAAPPLGVDRPPGPAARPTASGRPACGSRPAARARPRRTAPGCPAAAPARP